MNEPLAKNYLQPKFLYPLGARPLSTLSTSTFVLQSLRDRPELMTSLPDSSIFDRFRQHPFIVKSLPPGALENIQLQWQENVWSDLSFPKNNVTKNSVLSSVPTPENLESGGNAIATPNPEISPNLPSSDSQKNPQPIPPHLQRFVSSPSSPNSSPTEQKKSPKNPPSSSSPSQQQPKTSRFEQHPGTRVPANIQREIEAQTPASPSPPNRESEEAIATPNPEISPNLPSSAQPQNPQPVPPNLQRFVSSPSSPNSSPTGQEQSLENPPSSSSPSQQQPKTSRFAQHPGTRVPASIQRDIEAQNNPPTSPTPQKNRQQPQSNMQGSPRRSWLEQAQENLTVKLQNQQETKDSVAEKSSTSLIQDPAQSDRAPSSPPQASSSVANSID
ncbi:MAG: hypothetical protein AB4290_25650, partial [Spirulina sp.]